MSQSDCHESGFPGLCKSAGRNGAAAAGIHPDNQNFRRLNAPIFAAIAGRCTDCHAGLFSNQWDATIPIVQILCLYAIVRSTGNPIGSLQLAKGRADIGFMWTVGVLILLGPFIYLGAKIAGLIGIACALLGA